MSSGDATTAVKPVSAQLRAENIAYAVQNGVYSIAANLFEPYINFTVQKFYAKSHHDERYGNYSQNLVGEIAGDLVGAGSFILAETLAPKQLHACTRTIRRCVDPVYDRLAHHMLDKEKDSPNFEKKIEDWKVFQERNFARSLVMMTTGIAGNVVTQKLMGNPSPSSMIFTGKLISTSITMALGLGGRIAFPKQAKSVDRWLGEKFKPMMEGDGYSAPEPLPGSFAERITKRRSHEHEMELSV